MESPQKAIEAGKAKLVMQKYAMYLSEEDVMGEGTSSVCRRGTCLETDQTVAIKVYKTKKKGKGTPEEAAVNIKKFKRQIQVLTELMRPLERTSDSTLWCEELETTPASKIFMQLLDYSKDETGEPGPDTTDGVMYVITEVAQYSLKDFIKLRREQKKPLSKETVKSIAKSITLVTAGLHAKGLVHLDLKPENLMVFNGSLKLIDVDGCVRIGTTVSINDSSLSFSPCYCAPEWAAFLIDESAEEPTILASPALDCWSIGMTICELAILDAALKPTYASFMRHGRSHQEAGFLFMEWLSGLKKAPVPRAVEKFDKGLVEFVSSCMLVCSPVERKTLAQSLSHPYIGGDGSAKAPKEEEKHTEEMPQEAPRHRRHRTEDTSDKYFQKGTLWKLNKGGDPKEPAHWIKRDMWISNNGSLCYFSIKEGKRLVLLDSHVFSGAEITRLTGAAKDPAFTIKTRVEDADHHDGEQDTNMFACDSEEDYASWVHACEKAKQHVLSTMALGMKIQELRTFRLAVKNRRLKVGNDGGQYEPVFKGTLWKVKADGDRMKETDWFERDMWLSKNGSLVYWSKKEEKELVYYTHSDLAQATFANIPEAESFRPWAFQVNLKATEGVEFSPGEFAAESEDMRETWLEEFRKAASVPLAEA